MPKRFMIVTEEVRRVLTAVCQGEEYINPSESELHHLGNSHMACRCRCIDDGDVARAQPRRNRCMLISKTGGF